MEIKFVPSNPHDVEWMLLILSTYRDTSTAAKEPVQLELPLPEPKRKADPNQLELALDAPPQPLVTEEVLREHFETENNDCSLWTPNPSRFVEETI